jgi:hypothetical protein
MFSPDDSWLVLALSVNRTLNELSYLSNIPHAPNLKSKYPTRLQRISHAPEELFTFLLRPQDPMHSRIRETLIKTPVLEFER